MRYSEELIAAVKYLYERGFRSSEIAKRLDVSPFTIRNIISLLNKKPKMKEFIWVARSGNGVVIKAPENVHDVLERLREKVILWEIIGIAKFIKAMGLGEYKFYESKPTETSKSSSRK
ncbi:MAG: transposase [Candidatus Nezhaarchaeales archaeon]